ncbi:MAG TPA: signal peptide peptidase SppA [Candidatus Binataceae bacterium]
MRRLLRWILRTALTILVLVAIAAISDYVSHRVPNNSVLMVKLTGPLVERGATGVLGLFNPHQTSLNYVRRAINQGAKDPRIAGLAIKVIDPEMELAQAQELADLIKGFASKGKWTTAYIETAGESGPGNLPFMVASAAHEVSLMPQGELNIIGVGVRELFARGTLDWLGIRPNFASIGQYKTAANMFTNKDFTQPQREEDEALVSDMFDQIVNASASERQLSPEAIRAVVDQAPLTAAAGLKAHLVDRLEYEDEFTERVKHYGGGDHPVEKYENYSRGRLFGGFGARDRIAVIYGDGAIERGQGGFDPLLSPGGTSMGSDDIASAFKTARDDDSVRAVVFRINSPGGSVIGSELIRRQVELTQRKKPVVVSMSSYAASGGYWVATPADKILADPGTITGSIGVLGGKFNVFPAAQKIYLNSAAVTRGANVEMFDEFTDFTPTQMKMFQEQVLGDTYQYFLKIVAAGRHLPVEQVNNLAQGRVWTGRQALANKLIDAIGGFDDAMREARTMARLSPDQAVSIVELPEQPGFIQALLSGRTSGALPLAEPSARILQPIVHLVGAALRHRGAFGEAYCPIVPVM